MKNQPNNGLLLTLIIVISATIPLGQHTAAREAPITGTSQPTSYAQKRHSAKRPAKTRGTVPVRVDNRFGLGVNAGVFFFGMGYGLEGWYIPRKTIHAGLQLFASDDNIEGVAIEASNIREEMRLKTVMTSIFVRYSFLYGLYVNSALRLGSFKGKYGFAALNNEAENRFQDLSADAMMLSFSVGSHTTFKTGHYFGIDWLGVGMPLKKSVNLEVEAVDPNTSTVDDISTFFTGSSSNKRAENMFNDQFKIYYLLLRAGYEF